MSIYIEYFNFPSLHSETSFIHPKDNDSFVDRKAQVYKGSLYPFKILSKVGLYEMDFDDITILYGGNGCGKTTALNAIAEALGIKRNNLFNKGKFYNDFIDMCGYGLVQRKGLDDWEEDVPLPKESKIIVSDDVFKCTMERRRYNSEFNDANVVMKEEYEAKAMTYKKNYERQLAMMNRNAVLKKQFLKEEIEQSNGESAMTYFLENMSAEALYILDEPENSLSMQNQIELANYIADAARFFNSQFIIATHSPFFVSIPNAKIYSFEIGKVVNRKWTELEGIKTMFDFFDSHRNEFL